MPVDAIDVGSRLMARRRCCYCGDSGLIDARAQGPDPWRVFSCARAPHDASLRNEETRKLPLCLGEKRRIRVYFLC